MKNKNLRYFQLAFFFLSFLTFSLNLGILFHILTALKLLFKTMHFNWSLDSPLITILPKLPTLPRTQ